MNIDYIRITLRCMMLALWLPAIAFASTVTLSQTLSGVTPSALVIVVLLSSLSGATALLQRIDRELRDTNAATLPRPALFACAHMLGSWLAGSLAFILAEGQNVNDWLELGLIICSSFAGAKFIEAVSEKYLSRILPVPKEPVP